MRVNYMADRKKEIGGAARETAGKVEKELGKVTGKRDMEVKGKMKEEHGKAEKEMGKVQRKM